MVLICLFKGLKVLFFSLSLSTHKFTLHHKQLIHVLQLKKSNFKTMTSSTKNLFAAPIQTAPPGVFQLQDIDLSNSINFASIESIEVVTVRRPNAIRIASRKFNSEQVKTIANFGVKSMQDLTLNLSRAYVWLVDYNAAYLKEDLDCINVPGFNIPVYLDLFDTYRYYYKILTAFGENCNSKKYKCMDAFADEYGYDGFELLYDSIFPSKHLLLPVAICPPAPVIAPQPYPDNFIQDDKDEVIQNLFKIRDHPLLNKLIEQDPAVGDQIKYACDLIAFSDWKLEDPVFELPMPPRSMLDQFDVTDSEQEEDEEELAVNQDPVGFMKYCERINNHEIVIPQPLKKKAIPQQAIHQEEQYYTIGTIEIKTEEELYEYFRKTQEKAGWVHDPQGFLDAFHEFEQEHHREAIPQPLLTCDVVIPQPLQVIIKDDYYFSLECSEIVQAKIENPVRAPCMFDLYITNILCMTPEPNFDQINPKETIYNNYHYHRMNYLLKKHVEEQNYIKVAEECFGAIEYIIEETVADYENYEKHISLVVSEVVECVCYEIELGPTQESVYLTPHQNTYPSQDYSYEPQQKEQEDIEFSAPDVFPCREEVPMPALEKETQDTDDEETDEFTEDEDTTSERSDDSQQDDSDDEFEEDYKLFEMAQKARSMLAAHEPFSLEDIRKHAYYANQYHLLMNIFFKLTGFEDLDYNDNLRLLGVKLGIAVPFLESQQEVKDAVSLMMSFRVDCFETRRFQVPNDFWKPIVTEPVEDMLAIEYKANSTVTIEDISDEFVLPSVDVLGDGLNDEIEEVHNEIPQRSRHIHLHPLLIRQMFLKDNEHTTFEIFTGEFGFYFDPDAPDSFCAEFAFKEHYYRHFIQGKTLAPEEEYRSPTSPPPPTDGDDKSSNYDSSYDSKDGDDKNTVLSKSMSVPTNNVEPLAQTTTFNLQLTDQDLEQIEIMFTELDAKKHEPKVLRLRGGVGNQTSRARFNMLTDRQIFDQYIAPRVLPSFLDHFIYQRIVQAGMRLLTHAANYNYNDRQTVDQILQAVAASPNRSPVTTNLYNLMATFANMDIVQVRGTFNLRRQGAISRTFTYRVRDFDPRSINTAQLQAEFVRRTIAEVIAQLYDDEIESIDPNVEIFAINNLPTLDQIRMFGKKQQSVLNAVNSAGFSHRAGSCVIDYIYSTMQKADSKFNSITPQKIQQEFIGLGVDIYNGISTRDIMLWAKLRNNISCYALNPVTLQVFSKHIATGDPRLILTFFVALSHCYPISDEKLQSIITHSCRLDYKSLPYTSFCIMSDNIKELTTDDQIQLFIDGEDQKVADGVAQPDACVVETELKDIMRKVMTDQLNGDIMMRDDEDLTTWSRRINSGKEIQLIDQLRFDAQGQVSGFIHPVSGMPIRKSQDFAQRKLLCDFLFQKYQAGEFIFVDQQWASIAEQIQNHIIGQLTSSNDAVNDSVMLYFQPMAIVQRMHHSINTDIPVNGLALDHNMCYSIALRDNVDKIPIYCELDNIVPYYGMNDCSEYLVNAWLHSSGIRFAKQWYTYSSIVYLMQHGHITVANIDKQRTFRKYHEPSIFVKLFDFLIALECELNMPKLTKKLMNPLIGFYNERTTTKTKGYMTDDQDEALALSFQALADGFEFDIQNLFEIDRSVYICKFMESKQKKENFTSIWRMVVCNANINVLKKLDELRSMNDNLILHAVRVDALYLSCSVPVRVEYDEKWKELDEWKPPKYDHFGTVRDTADFIDRPWEACDADTITNTPVSCLIDGPAGSGKTTKLIAMLNNVPAGSRILITAFTHTALVVIRNRLTQAGIEFGPGTKKTVRTLDSWITAFDAALTRGQGDIESSRFDYIFIDEVSMINTKHLCKIREIANHFGNVSEQIFFGDFNQCTPVEQVHYNYKNVHMFKKLCGHRCVTLQFIANSGRYDIQTYSYLRYFIDNRQMHPNLNTHNRLIDPNLPVNIVYHNRLRREINNQFDGYRYHVGQEVIGDSIDIKDKKLKDSGFYQSAIYTLKSVNFQKAFVQVETYDDEDPDNVQIILTNIPFSKIEPTFAVTVYKYQGKTIKRPYNIHEAAFLSFEEMYTALSRTTTWTNWHFEYTDKVFQNKPLISLCIGLSKPQPRNIITVDDEYFVLDAGVTVEQYIHLEGSSAQEINFVGITTSSSVIGMNRHLEKVQGKSMNLVKTACNFLDADVLKMKFPIHQTSSEMSIRKTVNNEMINIRRSYTIDTYTEVKAFFEEEQKRLMDYYYNELHEVQNKYFEPIPYPITFTKPKYTETVIEQNVVPEVIVPVVETFTIQKIENIINPFQVKWYFKQLPAQVDAILNGLSMIKTVKPHPTLYDKDVHMYASTSYKQLNELIAIGLNTHTPMYYYEILNGNCRLYCDLDLPLDFEDGCEDMEQILCLALELIEQAALTFKVTLSRSRFRVLSGCTEQKISYHITHLDHVFEKVEDQKSFWNKVNEISRGGDYADLFYKKNGVSNPAIDYGVYTKNRSMRTIFSTKPRKHNRLFPVTFDTLDGIQVVDEAQVVDNVSEYFITVKHNGAFSPLHDIYVKNKVIHKPISHVNQHYLKPLSDTIKNVLRTITNLPDGFDITNCESYQDANSMRFIRQRSAYCPACKRIHGRENMLGTLKNGVITIRCVKGGKWKAQLA